MAFVVHCYDLLIKNGTIYDPERGITMKGHIGIYEPNIADVIDPEHFEGKICALRVIDAEGLYVIPGIVECHSHVLPDMGFKYRVEDLYKRGIVATCDMGSDSFVSFNRSRKQVINDAPIVINAALCVSTLGDTGGTLPLYDAEMNAISKEQIKEAFEIHPDVLIGVKVFVGKGYAPTPEITHAVFKKSREVCDYVGTRMIVHVTDPAVSLPEWIPYFKEGDIVTHTYNGGENSLLRKDGTVWPEAWEAKKRGVIFDSCRGSRNWCAAIAKPAFEQGFYPDLITADLTSLSNDPYTSRLNIHMSECMAFGMNFKDVLYRVTDVPSKIMKGVKVGLKRGLPANITVVDLEKGPHTFGDATGAKYQGDVKIVPKATIVNGKVMYDVTNSEY
jgi:dihydroorotase